MFRTVAWISGIGIMSTLFGAVFFVPKMIDWTQYRVSIAHHISVLTGRSVVIDGDIEVSLFPSPVVQLSSLRIENVAEAQNVEFLNVGFVEANIDAVALFSGQLVLKTLAVQGASLSLERVRPEVYSWSFQQKTQGTSTGLTATAPIGHHGQGPGQEDVDTPSNVVVLEATQLRIQDSRVYMADHVTGLTSTLSDVQGQIDFEPRGGAITITMEGLHDKASSDDRPPQQDGAQELEPQDSGPQAVNVRATLRPHTDLSHVFFTSIHVNTLATEGESSLAFSGRTEWQNGGLKAAEGKVSAQLAQLAEAKAEVTFGPQGLNLTEASWVLTKEQRPYSRGYFDLFYAGPTTNTVDDAQPVSTQTLVADARMTSLDIQRLTEWWQYAQPQVNGIWHGLPIQKSKDHVPLEAYTKDCGGRLSDNLSDGPQLSKLLQDAPHVVLSDALTYWTCRPNVSGRVTFQADGVLFEDVVLRDVGVTLNMTPDEWSLSDLKVDFAIGGTGTARINISGTERPEVSSEISLDLPDLRAVFGTYIGAFLPETALRQVNWQGQLQVSQDTLWAKTVSGILDSVPFDLYGQWALGTGLWRVTGAIDHYDLRGSFDVPPHDGREGHMTSSLYETLDGFEMLDLTIGHVKNDIYSDLGHTQRIHMISQRRGDDIFATLAFEWPDERRGQAALELTARNNNLPPFMDVTASLAGQWLSIWDDKDLRNLQATVQVTGVDGDFAIQHHARAMGLNMDGVAQVRYAVGPEQSPQDQETYDLQGIWTLESDDVRPAAQAVNVAPDVQENATAIPFYGAFDVSGSVQKSMLEAKATVGNVSYVGSGEMDLLSGNGSSQWTVDAHDTDDGLGQTGHASPSHFWKFQNFKVKFD